MNEPLHNMSIDDKVTEVYRSIGGNEFIGELQRKPLHEMSVDEKLSEIVRAVRKSEV